MRNTTYIKETGNTNHDEGSSNTDLSSFPPLVPEMPTQATGDAHVLECDLAVAFPGLVVQMMGVPVFSRLCALVFGEP